jgi:hypothetical protein
MRDGVGVLLAVVPTGAVSEELCCLLDVRKDVQAPAEPT